MGNQRYTIRAEVEIVSWPRKDDVPPGVALACLEARLDDALKSISAMVVPGTAHVADMKHIGDTSCALCRQHQRGQRPLPDPAHAPVPLGELVSRSPDGEVFTSDQELLPAEATHSWHARWRCDQEEHFYTDNRVYQLPTTSLVEAARLVEADLGGSVTLIDLCRVDA